MLIDGGAEFSVRVANDELSRFEYLEKMTHIRGTNGRRRPSVGGVITSVVY